MPNVPFESITSTTDLCDKYVFLSASLDVPIVNNVIQNDFRLQRGLPTIQFLVEQGARVVVCGHMGSDGEQSTKPVADWLGQHVTVTHSSEVVGSQTTELRDNLQAGQVLVLENVRRDPREKQNDADFARALADLADVYVNDDFPTAHRAQASLAAITEFLPAYAGIDFTHEYTELMKARQPEQPALFILGGAKFDTKMPLVTAFLDLYDHIFIGGALANDFFKAKGYEVGQSLVSDIDLSSSPLLTNPKLIIPIDVTVKRQGESVVVAATDVQPDDSILDVGPASVEQLGGLIAGAKMVLWNGPLGNYEGGYDTQTIATANKIAASASYSIVGGGDTIAATEATGDQSAFDFLSTAGGAMLTFLEKGTLPAVEAILQAPNYR